MIRQPAVAGQFYPAEAAEVEAKLEELIPRQEARRTAVGLVVPHAGWIYSGMTAGLAYSQVRVPNRVILVGPNHHNLGSSFAVYEAGAWHTPLGDVPIAEALTAELLDNCEWLASDPRAHSAEHCLEVQVPMLLHANPQVQIAPILIGGNWPESGSRLKLQDLGKAIGQTLREYGQPVLLVASTDLNHYEDQETNRIKDKLVLDAMVSLDEDALMDRVIDVEVSMCGVAAAYVVLVAAKKLGARRGELLDYRTSGDVSGDYRRVVGYGAVAIE